VQWKWHGHVPGDLSERASKSQACAATGWRQYSESLCWGFGEGRTPTCGTATTGWMQPLSLPSGAAAVELIANVPLLLYISP
jgi:hypothetical protein